MRAGEETIPYRVFAVFVLPGQELDVEALAGPEVGPFDLAADRGTVTPRGEARWSWSAPQRPGLYHLDVAAPRSAARIHLNAFVLVPYERLQNGRLNGYRIGHYPDKPLRGLPIYRPPTGFVEVSPVNRHTRVSPHFTLEQFLCKQAGSFPKYVALRGQLLLKLESILAGINRAGIRADTLTVMSGFRTPFYNSAIGNVRYSRHQWGGAADIFVDRVPRDGRMDDVNGDGRVDVGDARFLYNLVERLQQRPGATPLVGGLGLYGSTSSHGPFVHVDARGFPAHWAGSGV